MWKMTKEKQDYKNMKARCYNKNTTHYHRYGGRGITVCDEWLNNFESFEQWHKQTYIKGMTIDRIDNNRGYTPTNCRWVSMKVQSNNRQNRSKLYNNYTEEELSDACEYYTNTNVSQSELAKLMNVPRTTLQALLYSLK